MVGQLPRCRVRQMRPDGTRSTGQEGQGRTGTGGGRGTRSEPPARSTGVANRHVHRKAIALPVIVRDRDCGTGATSEPSRRAPWPQRCQIGRGPGARPKARLVSAHGTDRSPPGTRFAPLLRPPGQTRPTTGKPPKRSMAASAAKRKVAGSGLHRCQQRRRLCPQPGPVASVCTISGPIPVPHLTFKRPGSTGAGCAGWLGGPASSRDAALIARFVELRYNTATPDPDSAYARFVVIGASFF
jgi:hypothetical protein